MASLGNPVVFLAQDSASDEIHVNIYLRHLPQLSQRGKRALLFLMN